MRTAITLGLIGLASAISISVQDQRSTFTPCDTGNMDCSCADKSFNLCIEPQSTVSVHVSNLEECILNCDLFSSFGQCEWMIFYNNGPDENCRLFAAGETMEQYLGSCTVVGQPLRYDGDPGTCMGDDIKYCEGPAQALQCPGTPPCKACDDNNRCNVNYHQAQCSMTALGTVVDIGDLSYENCQAFCTLQSVSNPFTYFTWDKTAEVCDCFEGGQCASGQCGGKRNCQLEVVKAGFTMDEITKCKSGEIVGGACTSDSDCGGNLLCDLSGVPVCKTGCRQHSDCKDVEYCTCQSCPDPGVIGECMTGCRDLGTACLTSAGNPGTCNPMHVCTPEGIPKLNSIGLKTTSCTGCNSRVAAGARLEISLVNAPSLTCTTGILDNPGVADYNPAGGEANFSDELLEGCKLIDNYGVGATTVTWEGAGSWTPEVVNVYLTGPSVWSCKNTNGLEVSAGSSIELNDCDIGL